jgi:uncharacterized protein YndB with AHSA1/START domain
MAKKIGLALLAIVVVFLGYAGTRSPDYRVSREVTINAPVEKVFPYLNNSKLSEKWGPWAEMDPASKMEYSGPESGVGARTSWDSKTDLGTGSATIVESVPNQRVGIRIEYTKPMQMIQDSAYIVKASGNQSVVTWSVTGKNSFLGRVMCMFMDMDKMVGGMFEKGLSKLKGIVEGGQA